MSGSPSDELITGNIIMQETINKVFGTTKVNPNFESTETQVSYFINSLLSTMYDSSHLNDSDLLQVMADYKKLKPYIVPTINEEFVKQAAKTISLNSLQEIL